MSGTLVSPVRDGCHLPIIYRPTLFFSATRATVVRPARPSLQAAAFQLTNLSHDDRGSSLLKLEGFIQEKSNV